MLLSFYAIPLTYVAIATVLMYFFSSATTKYSLHTKKTCERKNVFVCMYSYLLKVFTSLRSLYLMCTFADVALAEHAVLFPGVCNVAPGAALAVRQSSRPLLLSDFLQAEPGAGVPAAAPSAWPALKRHHHQRKRALKCLLVLSPGFPFTALWKPHSPQPDNSSRCLDGVQIAAYSLRSVRMAQS